MIRWNLIHEGEKIQNFASVAVSLKTASFAISLIQVVLVQSAQAYRGRGWDYTAASLLSPHLNSGRNYRSGSLKVSPPLTS
jgi:hypothetical protein